MEYQKIINLLNNRNTQPSRFRKRNWVEINDRIEDITQTLDLRLLC